MPLPDQSVLRKVGSLEVYRARQGSLTMACLRSRKLAASLGVQAVGGMGVRWYLRARLRSGAARTAN